MTRTIEIEFDGIDGKDYYESRSVGAGRSSYSCQHCGKRIETGKPSQVHTFYPEFQGYRTHPECTNEWLKKIGARDYGKEEEVFPIASTKEQIQSELDVRETVDEFAFAIHEASKTNKYNPGIFKFEEKLSEILEYKVEDNFKIECETKLGEKIIFKIGRSKVNYEIK